MYPSLPERVRDERNSVSDSTVYLSRVNEPIANFQSSVDDLENGVSAPDLISSKTQHGHSLPYVLTSSLVHFLKRTIMKELSLFLKWKRENSWSQVVACLIRTVHIEAMTQSDRVLIGTTVVRGDNCFSLCLSVSLSLSFSVSLSLSLFLSISLCLCLCLSVPCLLPFPS